MGCASLRIPDDDVTHFGCGVRHGYWKVRAQESAWLSDDIGIGESKGPGEESSRALAKNEREFENLGGF